MKRPDENIEKKLERLLGEIGNADVEQMDRRITAVGQSLRPIARESRERAPAVHGRRLNFAVIAAAVAAMLVIALSSTFWRPGPVVPVNPTGQTVQAPPATVSEPQVMTLEDGSRVEKREGSELNVERVPDGLRIRLEKGAIIVTAAKQTEGRHLYVQTKDVTVSVVGTVFLVNADASGSRVAVIEGAVHVRQGAVEKNLQPGEQVSSNKKMEELALQVQIGWSREAAAYLALLHDSLAQKLAARQASQRSGFTSDKPQFEEASIRLCEQEFRAPEGMRGGGSNSFRLSPGRLDALCMTPATLIRTAYRQLRNNTWGPRVRRDPLWLDTTYGLGMEDGTRVRGGPDWVRSEKYTIAAVAPGRTDAPTLGGPMLLGLLENRFQLKMHVEAEDFPVWVLKVAKDGLKVKALAKDSCVRYPPLTKAPDEEDMRRFEEASKTTSFCRLQMRPAPPNMKLVIDGGTMSQLADVLSEAASSPLHILSTSLDNRLVLNQTGIPDTEVFNFALEFGADPSAWAEMQQLGALPAQFTDPLGPTIFEALAKLGLTLERSKDSREFIVIDQIERPSPN
jgi:uncharacterized protein (TIGR03435 family)